MSGSKKERELVKIGKGQPRELMAGINMYTATTHLGKPLTDDDAYRLLADKPGRMDF